MTSAVGSLSFWHSQPDWSHRGVTGCPQSFTRQKMSERADGAWPTLDHVVCRFEAPGVVLKRCPSIVPLNSPSVGGVASSVLRSRRAWTTPEISVSAFHKRRPRSGGIPRPSVWLRNPSLSWDSSASVRLREMARDDVVNFVVVRDDTLKKKILCEN